MGSFPFPNKQRLSEGKPLERCTRAAAWRQQRHMAISEIAYKAKPNCIRCQLPLHQHKEPVHKRLSFLSVWSKFRTKEYLCSFPGKDSASCTNQYFPIANTNIAQDGMVTNAISFPGWHWSWSWWPSSASPLPTPSAMSTRSSIVSRGELAGRICHARYCKVSNPIELDRKISNCSECYREEEYSAYKTAFPYFIPRPSSSLR